MTRWSSCTGFSMRSYHKKFAIPCNELNNDKTFRLTRLSTNNRRKQVLPASSESDEMLACVQEHIYRADRRDLGRSDPLSAPRRGTYWNLLCPSSFLASIWRFFWTSLLRFHCHRRLRFPRQVAKQQIHGARICDGGPSYSASTRRG